MQPIYVSVYVYARRRTCGEIIWNAPDAYLVMYDDFHLNGRMKSTDQSFVQENPLEKFRIRKAQYTT